ncbi:hypothetical protein [Collimonas sp.]|uniref:hypothetical protein n=1 Tax=Collimonas sp. TaxID=1963772 RepID=UPI002B7B15B5|nr:hypothetical protein [Collimonas sp.]HWX00850.1 hypothetical protein [Collimonas sp.]
MQAINALAKSKIAMRTPDLRGATIAADDPAIFFNTAVKLKTATDIHFQKGKLALPDDGVTALAYSALGARRLAADRIPDPSLNAMLEKIKFPQRNISAAVCIFVLLDLSVASQPRLGPDPPRRQRRLQFEYERATFSVKFRRKY